MFPASSMSNTQKGQIAKTRIGVTAKFDLAAGQKVLCLDDEGCFGWVGLVEEVDVSKSFGLRARQHLAENRYSAVRWIAVRVIDDYGYAHVLSFARLSHVRVLKRRDQVIKLIEAGVQGGHGLLREGFS